MFKASTSVQSFMKILENMGDTKLRRPGSILGNRMGIQVRKAWEKQMQFKNQEAIMFKTSAFI